MKIAKTACAAIRTLSTISLTEFVLILASGMVLLNFKYFELA